MILTDGGFLPEGLDAINCRGDYQRGVKYEHLLHNVRNAPRLSAKEALHRFSRHPAYALLLWTTSLDAFDQANRLDEFSIVKLGQ